MYHGRVPGVISLQVIRDGIPQLASTFPLRTGTAVRVLFCFLAYETLFRSLFCGRGLGFRKMR